MSSAYIYIWMNIPWCSTILVMLDVYRMKRMEPRETQNIKLDILKNLAPKQTLWVLEERKDEIQRNADAEIPNCIWKIWSKIVWSTQSNAALKSRRRRKRRRSTDMNPRSRADTISLDTFKTAVSVCLDTPVVLQKIYYCNSWMMNNWPMMLTIVRNSTAYA